MTTSAIVRRALSTPLRRLLAAAAVMASAAGVVAPALARADSTAVRAPIAVGVTVAADDNPTDVANYVTAAGRNPSILMWYSNWGGPLYYSRNMPWNDSVGATPMITWEPSSGGVGISFDSIATGGYDAYVDRSAAQAKVYGKTILIRFAHEMNLPGSPYGPGHDGDTPASFVAAWRHVVSRFAADGATNVKWVWSPNVNCSGACPFDSYFPGDAYLDYVALDGYNFAAVHNIANQSFTTVFAGSYADITALSTKPVIIAETATAGDGAYKAGWMEDAFRSAIPASFPRVSAVIWFDRVKETDWRVNYSALSSAEWHSILTDSLYQGRLS